MTVKEVFEGGIQITFSRWLYPELQAQWDRICEWLNVFSCHEGSDIICWKWGRKKLSMVKSLYKTLSSGGQRPELKHIWKSKILPKIKIFLWLLENNVILTKDNMVRRKWIGSIACPFCDQEESVDH